MPGRNKAEAVTNLLGIYWRLSMLGAYTGGGIGALISILWTPVISYTTIDDCNSESRARAHLGQKPMPTTEYLERITAAVGNLWKWSAGLGFFLGGAPVTYPAFRLATYAQEKLAAIEELPEENETERAIRNT